MITSTAWYNPNEIKMLVPNLVAFISKNEKNVWFFNYRAKDGTHMFDAK